MPKKDPCKEFACRIQACLKANNFQEAACQKAIDDMKDCCRIWGTKSFVCHGMNVESKSKQ